MRVSPFFGVELEAVLLESPLLVVVPLPDVVEPELFCVVVGEAVAVDVGTAVFTVPPAASLLLASPELAAAPAEETALSWVLSAALPAASSEEEEELLAGFCSSALLFASVPLISTVSNVCPDFNRGMYTQLV